MLKRTFIFCFISQSVIGSVIGSTHNELPMLFVRHLVEALGIDNVRASFGVFLTHEPETVV